MKKVFTLISMLCMVLGLQAQTYELSPGTYKESVADEAAGTQTWKFTSNGKDFEMVSIKGYAEGSGNTKGTLKLSRNVDFTVNMPADLAVTGIKVRGWSNVDETSTDLSTLKINGVDDTNTLPYKTATTPAEFTIDFSKNPLQGSFVLRVNGAQACMNVTLITGEGGGEVTPEEPENYNASATYALAVDEAHTAGEVVSVKDDAGEEIATLTFGIKDEADYLAAEADKHIDGFVAYTKGNNVSGKKDGSAGTMYIIVPKYDGKIEAGVVLNANKAFYVLEDGTALNDYNGITVAEKYYGTYSFKVKAGKSYIVTCAGSKLGFYGFNYAYNKEGGTEPPTPVVTIAKPTFVVDGVTYESGATVEGLTTGQAVTIKVEEGKYIYTNWSGKTGNAKADYYKADRMKGQTSYNASTSTGGQRVLYAVAGDTDNATGNSSDLAYIVFKDVVASEPVVSVIPYFPEIGRPAIVSITKGCETDIVRYTLDGSIPTADSPEYTGDIELTTDAVVSFVAFDKNNANPSNVVVEAISLAFETELVEITSAGYATFYNGNEYPVLPPSEVTAYAATVNGTTVTLSDPIWPIAPGEAVILKGEPGRYDFVINPFVQQNQEQTTNLLKGFEKTQMIQGEEGFRYYKLAVGKHGVGFYPGAENYGPFESQGGKAYLAVPAELQANFFLFDGATGINSVVATQGTEDIYNLQGVRMSGKLAKGVYVKGGKKFVVK